MDAVQISAVSILVKIPTIEKTPPINPKSPKNTEPPIPPPIEVQTIAVAKLRNQPFTPGRPTNPAATRPVATPPTSPSTAMYTTSVGPLNHLK